MSVETLGATELALVAQLAAEMRTQAERVAQLEAELKAAKAAAKVLEEERLPAAMQDLGVLELKLADGSKISVETEYHASIPKKHRAAAYKYLRDNGFGALIKNEVVVEFPREEDEPARELAARLREEFPENLVNFESGIHSSTLKALVKEQYESGSPLPEEPFGIYIITRATIEQPKQGR